MTSSFPIAKSLQCATIQIECDDVVLDHEYDVCGYCILTSQWLINFVLFRTPNHMIHVRRCHKSAQATLIINDHNATCVGSNSYKYSVILAIHREQQKCRAGDGAHCGSLIHHYHSSVPTHNVYTYSTRICNKIIKIKKKNRKLLYASVWINTVVRFEYEYVFFILYTMTHFLTISRNHIVLHWQL